VRGQHQAPTAPYPQERPGTHFTGAWDSAEINWHNCVRWK